MRRVVLLACVLVFAFAACTKDTTGTNSTLSQALKAHAAGNTTEATKLYRQVLVTDPGNKYAWYNLGLIAQTTGDIGQADTDYGRALLTDPRFVSALFNLAILRTSEKRTKEAITLYQKILQVDPKNASAHLNLGFLLGANTAAGQAELAEAVRLDSSLSKRIATPAPSKR